MAEAKITLSLTPREFDLVRASLEWVRSNQDQVARDTSTARGIRDEARQEAFQLGEILSKLK